MNGDCIKPKRKLLEFCNEEEHCDSDFQCKRIGERNFCSCQEGFEIFDGKCLQVEVSLGDDCEDDRQCTSIECAKCVYNETLGNHLCACEEKCIQNGRRCLLSNRRLYESCEVSKQCRGTLNAKECRYVEGIKLCHCPDGYAVFGGICLKGGVSLRGICIFSEQCTGTQNAGTCLYYNEERETVCSCDQGFFEEGEKCLEGMVSSGQSCVESTECSSNSEVCVQGECSPDKSTPGADRDKRMVSSGQSCVESTQCSSNSEVCVHGESTPDADRDKRFTRRLLFVGFGSFVVGVLGTVFVFSCLRRRKRRHERLDMQTQELELSLNTYVVHSEIIYESAENNPPRLDEDDVGGGGESQTSAVRVFTFTI
ncbi:protein kinase C-binding protein NELL2-like [Ostrea edulis]|uniref:protein kinase C-binding protein NELL2-like n=1 Tax=Ostrea edulis TaxID=37623 RepID=UPI0024AFC74A|nr:protein kinase C-binding protein NELL2-like [Ostrea edulis]